MNTGANGQAWWQAAEETRTLLITLLCAQDCKHSVSLGQMWAHMSCQTKVLINIVRWRIVHQTGKPEAWAPAALISPAKYSEVTGTS